MPAILYDGFKTPVQQKEDKIQILKENTKNVSFFFLSYQSTLISSELTT